MKYHHKNNLNLVNDEREGDKKAITERLTLWQFLATIFVVERDDDDGEGFTQQFTPTMSTNSTRDPLSFCDKAVKQRLEGLKSYLNSKKWDVSQPSISILLVILTTFFWKFFFTIKIMADGIRRAMQDIDLGASAAPVVMPAEMVRQAAEENRFIIIGRPVMPRRQNLRAIVATMPRTWGLEGIVRGRITEGRRFQFVFPSEEAMETVFRRGPWAYAERMLVLQRWTPLMDMGMMNFIPFWVQIRGIPLQYMNREVILFIARNMGQYIQMEYNEETGGRLEFVRVRLNWNVNHPLQFQRNFQFTPGENTLLRIQYERLRGFCESCGLITHDTGACVINNGGDAPDAGDNDSGDDHDDVELVPNQGIIIEEINDEDIGPEEEAPVEHAQEMYERQVEEMEEVADDEELGRGPYIATMFSDEYNTEEMYSTDPFGLRAAAASDKDEIAKGMKRKVWMEEADVNKAKFTKREWGESSTLSASRLTEEQREDNAEQSTNKAEQRGAVGPEPPLPP
ncbi:uncharacterized protein LOC130511686 [Raphanus sativus]|uniref:Uncharacterized protein LOC130511686 n=1 Tax=Raphanus sativus TaxID=3726 RepID=A0A9W3DMY6_RAPSA|nr:uncharacterized protein LOC130511686 [Raphanus sativus]